MELAQSQLEGLLQLRDRMDIAQVQHQYVRSVDDKDWETSMRLFHPNAKLYLIDRGEKRLLGERSEIESFYRGITEKGFIFSRHFITNPVIQTDGSNASFKSYYNATYIHPDFTWIIFGRYDDRMIKQGGEWKILEKEIDHGWNNFLTPFTQWSLPEESVRQAKKRLFVVSGQLVTK